jgi:hypothetical protein
LNLSLCLFIGRKTYTAKTPKRMSKEVQNPPPPEKPDPNECCGSGCVPCIYDYYFDRLEQWEQLNGITLTQYQEQFGNP